MARHLFFQMGSNQNLSLQEIESVFQKEYEVFSQFAFLELSLRTAKQKFYEMGGSVRMGEVLGETHSFEVLMDEVSSFLQSKIIEGTKMRVGLFFSGKNGWKKYGISLQKKLKAESKKNEFSLRVVNRGPHNLDTFAVKKEKLLEKGNSEICIISLPKGWAWGRTLAVQDAEGFSFRDMKKPVRDMQVGMLPPKLARIMLNLSRGEEGDLPEKVYDPFCGTGTVLLEALSLDLKISGSDLSSAMVQSTKQNTEWYFRTINESSDNRSPFFMNDIFLKDATHVFTPDQQKKVKNSVIVAEGFLGKIFHQPVSKKVYESQKEELFPLYRQMIFQVSQIGITTIVFGFPFWQGKEKNEYFSFVSEIIAFAEKMKWAQKGESIRYLRDGQVVGREIVVLRKK